MVSVSSGWRPRADAVATVRRDVVWLAQLRFVMMTCRVGPCRWPIENERGDLRDPRSFSRSAGPASRYSGSYWLLKQYFFFNAGLHGSSPTTENKLKDLRGCAPCSECFRPSLLRFHFLRAKCCFAFCRTAPMQSNIKEKILFYLHLHFALHFARW